MSIFIKVCDNKNRSREDTCEANSFWDMPGKDSEASCHAYRMFSLKKSNILKGRCCLGKVTVAFCGWLLGLPVQTDFRRTNTQNKRGTFGLGTGQRARTAELLDCLPSLRRVKMANSLSLYLSARHFLCRQEAVWNWQQQQELGRRHSVRICFVLFCCLQIPKTNNELFMRSETSSLIPFHVDEFLHK